MGVFSCAGAYFTWNLMVVLDSQTRQSITWFERYCFPFLALLKHNFGSWWQVEHPEYQSLTTVIHMALGEFYKWKTYTHNESYPKVSAVTLWIWNHSKNTPVLLLQYAFLVRPKPLKASTMGEKKSSAIAYVLCPFSKQFCNISVKLLLSCNKQLSDLELNITCSN